MRYKLVLQLLIVFCLPSILGWFKLTAQFPHTSYHRRWEHTDRWMLVRACWRHVQKRQQNFQNPKWNYLHGCCVYVLQFDTSYFLNPLTLSSPIQHMKREFSKAIRSSSSNCLAPWWRRGLQPYTQVTANPLKMHSLRIIEEKTEAPRKEWNYIIQHGKAGIIYWHPRR